MIVEDAIKAFKKSPRNSFTIFLFHGVVKKFNNKNTVTNYNNKNIHLKKFKFFLKKISNIGDPISMDDVYKIIKKKQKISNRSFAITFDDGFENNIKIAAPLLINFKIPFTIYITTKFVDENEMSWADKMDYAVDKTKSKNLRIEELKKDFNLQTRKSKILFLDIIRNFVKKNKNIDPYKFASKICKKLKVQKFPRKNIIYKKADWGQLKKISRNKLCIIGGHSHTHRILSYMNNKDLINEISKSIKMIKKNLSYDLKHYSYPEGFKESFSKKIINLLKKKSIKCCPTAISGINNTNSNLFLLKRVSVT